MSKKPRLGPKSLITRNCSLLCPGRAGGIRTRDLLTPSQARYQAAPRPDGHLYVATCNESVDSCVRRIAVAGLFSAGGRLEQVPNLHHVTPDLLVLSTDGLNIRSDPRCLRELPRLLSPRWTEVRIGDPQFSQLQACPRDGVALFVE